MRKDPLSELPQEIYSVVSVRNIDKTAIERGIASGYELMARAAEAAVDLAVDRFPAARRWEVICGAGNNGGDGYVVARLAADRGIRVSVCYLVSPETLSGDALTAYEDFSAANGQLASWQGALDQDAELLIDGLLGSGLERDVEGEFAAAVSAMNEHSAPILALDIPTGINGDTGAVMGVAVRAEFTMTFVGLKTGLFIGAGPGFVGEVCFAGLGIPEAIRREQTTELRRVNSAMLRRALPPRPRDAHKGDFGHVVLVGGGPGMPGAIRLAGDAALRAGAGRVSIATHPAHAASMTAKRPELMCHAIENPQDLEQLLAEASVVVLGPGLGKSDWAVNLFEYLIGCPLSLVLDADALNLLAVRQIRRDDWILTPHPGEAARLLALTTADIQADRRASLNQIGSQFGGCVVLKGAGTLISGGSDANFICSAGNPGMAAPGMGDVLTGIIAALWAQGLTQWESASVGVEIHAQAGDRASRAGERGMLASDLLEELRTGVNP